MQWRQPCVTVNIDVPLAPLTVAELKLQLGGTAADGVLLTAQVRFTVELKPPVGATVTVDVELLPGVIDVGASGVGTTVKDGDAVTTRLTVVEWVRLPTVP